MYRLDKKEWLRIKKMFDKADKALSAGPYSCFCGQARIESRICTKRSKAC
jgi:hypothetical protein